jgi:uncharacterized protein (TIGR02452 family)
VLNRSKRTALANKTIAIVAAGSYCLPDGRTVSIAPFVESCLAATESFPPARLRKVRNEVLARIPEGPPAGIEVRNETTLAAAARLLAAHPGTSVAALNFASAKNPGGGFLNGSQAQEESLARSSALYASLLRAPDYYETHRRLSSCLYTDAMILSPGCPVFRDDEGALLAEPYPVTFITSAAPNAGAVARNEPAEVAEIPVALRRRAELVLALAARSGCESLVLGAWGCGVFRNDPEMVAATFAELLAPDGVWARHFQRVAFAVLDTADRGTFESFRCALG